MAAAVKTIDASTTTVECSDGRGTPVADANQRPAIFSTNIQEYALVFCATMAVAMSSFFQGATVVTTASITTDLHMSSSELPWCTGANALTSGAFLLTFGRLADLLDRRWMLVISMSSFSLFTLILAFSPSGIFFIVVGGLIGFTGASSVTPATGLLGSIYRAGSQRKNLVFSVYGAGAPSGFVLGSVSAGIATQIGSWRASYVVISIVFALAAVLSWFTIPKQQGNKREDRALWDELKKIDILGSFLIVVGLGMFSAAFTLAPAAPKRWATSYVLVLLLLGLAIMALFVLWQNHAEYPLMPLKIWTDKTFTMLLIASMLGFASFNSAQFWLSLYLQRVKMDSPSMVAVQLLPQAIAGVLLNLACGLTMHAVRNEFLMMLGAACYTIAAVLLTFIRPHITYWALIFPYLLLAVVGVDFEFNIANVYVVSSFPRSQQALASGVFNTLMRTSVTFGLGASSAAHVTPPTAPAWKPYQSSFFVSVGLAGTSLIVALFLRIGKQGAISAQKKGPDQNSTPQGGVESDLGQAGEMEDLGRTISHCVA